MRHNEDGYCHPASSFKFRTSVTRVLQGSSELLPPLRKKLRPTSRHIATNNYLTHPTSTPNLTSCHQLFHSKLKALLFSKSYPDSSSSPSGLPPSPSSGA